MTGTSAGRPGLLSAEHVALIASGVSTIVASRNAQQQPSLMRAVGASITPQGEQITVYLNRVSARQVLDDLHDTGHIAVVFSEPYSHRTVQVKASRVQLRSAEPEDATLLQRYLAAMEVQLQRIGFGAHCTRTMLAHRLEDVVAVTFTPEQAYDQTPGPQAGIHLADGGGRA